MHGTICTPLFAGMAYRFFFAAFFLPAFFTFFATFLGTFAPAFLASDNPIAMACFLLVTFLPLRPLRRVPSFCLRIALATLAEAFLEYLAMTVFILPLKTLANALFGFRH